MDRWDTGLVYIAGAQGLLAQVNGRNGAMVANLSGRSRLTRLPMASPPPCWIRAGDRECGEHDGQLRLDRVAGVEEDRPSTQIGLRHAERLLDVTRSWHFAMTTPGSRPGAGSWVT